MNPIIVKLKTGGRIFNSIRNKLIIYFTVVFLLVISVVLLGNSNYLAFFKEYNTLYQEYNSLNKFFGNLNEATECIKSYYYTHNEAELIKYQSYIGKTTAKLEYLKSIALNDIVTWEYTKLANMLETYKETVNTAIKQNHNTNEYSQSGYDRIIRMNELINSTNVNYFNVIIEEMNFSRNKLYATWSTQRYLTIGIIIVLIVFGSVFSFLLLRSVTKPIGHLVRDIRQFMEKDLKRFMEKDVNRFMEGDYHASNLKGGGAEIEILSNAFNKMAISLGLYFREMKEKARLQQQLLEQENENLRMHSLLRETELRALQSQMNPHFLFNTLSIISKMAYIERAKQTTDLLESTTELLRYNVYNSNKVSDLNAEIACIKNYLYIQQKRFGDRIQFDLSVEEKLPNLKMPALIIQPLIENAIIHGVGNLVNGGMVKITVRRADDTVRISIEDNGVGIDSEVIENIMALGSPEAENGLGIGLVNVKRRLAMFFDGKAHLIIESSLGCGTVVTLTLPSHEGSKQVNDDV